MYKIPTRRLILLKTITVVIIFFAILSLAVAGFNVVYIRTSVKGDSMLPTLNQQYQTTKKPDIVYINRFNKGKVGDVVVLDLREYANFGDYAIKRVVAGGGDIVNIIFDGNDYKLIVNNEIIYSRPDKILGYNTYSSFMQYIQNHKHDKSRISFNENDQPNGVIVKKGEVYVLGDNWDVSKDSSLIGPITKKRIVGRVDIVVKPSQNEVWTILKGIF